MTTYDGTWNDFFLSGDKGALSNADELHKTLTFVFSATGLLFDASSLVTVWPMGWGTSDKFPDVSETATLGSKLYHM